MTLQGINFFMAKNNEVSSNEQKANGFLGLDLPVQFHNGPAKVCYYCGNENGMPNLDHAVRPKVAKTVCKKCNKLEKKTVSKFFSDQNTTTSWSQKIA